MVKIKLDSNVTLEGIKPERVSTSKTGVGLWDVIKTLELRLHVVMGC